MASSFDEVSHEDRTYREVMALYSAIKDTPGIMRVRRAEMRQGEVKAEPIDYIADVEIKAKRALHDDPLGLAEWTGVLDRPEQYMAVSEATQRTLGHAFSASRLGVDGDYKILFWRIKNHQHRISQEDTSGIFE